MTSNERCLWATVPPEEEEGGCGVFIERIAQTVSLRSRLWKCITTDGFVTLTACAIPLTQAVVISCRTIFTTRRMITKTVREKILLPPALNSCVLVSTTGRGSWARCRPRQDPCALHVVAGVLLRLRLPGHLHCARQRSGMRSTNIGRSHVVYICMQTSRNI
jgi:hypothetical protein